MILNRNGIFNSVFFFAIPSHRYRLWEYHLKNKCDRVNILSFDIGWMNSIQFAIVLQAKCLAMWRLLQGDTWHVVNSADLCAMWGDVFKVGPTVQLGIKAQNHGMIIRGLIQIWIYKQIFDEKGWLYCKGLFLMYRKGFTEATERLADFQFGGTGFQDFPQESSPLTSLIYVQQPIYFQLRPISVVIDFDYDPK